MLGGVVGLAVTFGGVELEGNANDDSRVAAAKSERA